MIKFVKMNDVNGTDKITELKCGERFLLNKDFEDYYGEHDSLVIVDEGIGFRKVEELEKKNRYVCLRVV